MACSCANGLTLDELRFKNYVTEGRCATFLDEARTGVSSRLVFYGMAEELFERLRDDATMGEDVDETQVQLCIERLRKSQMQLNAFRPTHDVIQQEVSLMTFRLTVAECKYEHFGALVRAKKFDAHVWDSFEWYLVHVRAACASKRVSMRRVMRVWSDLLAEKGECMVMADIKACALKEFGA